MANLFRPEPDDWRKEFRILSTSNLNFVLGENVGLAVGMNRSATPEFRRRVLAALISYQMGLSSIDYAKKKYVRTTEYQNEKLTLGDTISHFISTACASMARQMPDLHAKEDEFPIGRFASEITTFKIPRMIDNARLLADRGCYLEALPILRLCLEMTAWANAIYPIEEFDEIVVLKAQNCIASLRSIYPHAGRIYGYMSQFTHWGQIVHAEFLEKTREKVAVVYSSSKHRAMGLALCLVSIDILLDVLNHIYGIDASDLLLNIQRSTSRESRATRSFMTKIVDLTQIKQIHEINALLYN